MENPFSEKFFNILYSINQGQGNKNLIVNFYYLLDFWDNMMYFI